MQDCWRACGESFSGWIHASLHRFGAIEGCCWISRNHRESPLVPCHFPRPPQEAQAYLKAEDVQVDEVKHANFQSLQIGGTPTLLLVDSDGVVQKVWLGKLPEAEEQEVLDQSCRS